MVIAGGAGGGGGDLGQAGAGIFSGSSYQTYRSINRYRQSEEYAADQAAFSYLTRTKQSAKGMLETFEYFASQAIGSLKYSDPYVLSHPLPRQRIGQLRERAERSPYYNKRDSKELQLRHNMVRAKLEAFTSTPNHIFNKYQKSTLPHRYAKTIASFRSEGLRGFLPKINALIAAHPNNPYFHELKGQFLLEAGTPQQAIAPVQRAVKLLPKAGLIRIMLAQALSQVPNSKRNANTIIRHLRVALVQENRSSIGYRLLATSYARKGQIAQAELASARAYFYEGKLDLARNQASRAKKKLKRGSPGWIQADDILSFQRKR